MSHHPLGVFVSDPLCQSLSDMASQFPERRRVDRADQNSSADDAACGISEMDTDHVTVPQSGPC